MHICVDVDMLYLFGVRFQLSFPGCVRGYRFFAYHPVSQPASRPVSCGNDDWIFFGSFSFFLALCLTASFYLSLSHGMET